MFSRNNQDGKKKGNIFYPYIILFLLIFSASEKVECFRSNEDGNTSASSTFRCKHNEGENLTGEEHKDALQDNDHKERSVRRRATTPPRPVDRDAEERKQRGNLVNNWKEKVLSDATKGIPMENLPDYIDYLGDALTITDQSLVEKIADTIKELANDCTHKGLTSSISSKTGDGHMFAMFHCVKEEDGSVSIAYALHNIELEMQKKTLVTENPQGTVCSMSVEVESPIKDMENYQRNKALDMLKRLGVQSSPSKHWLILSKIMIMIQT